MGAGEIGFQLFRAQHIQPFEQHPMGACEIGRGDDVPGARQDVETVLPRLEGKALQSVSLGADDRENLAADFEHAVVAPLNRKHGPGKRKQIFLDICRFHAQRSCGGRWSALRACSRCSARMWRETSASAPAITAASSVKPMPATKSGIASMGTTK